MEKLMTIKGTGRAAATPDLTQVFLRLVTMDADYQQAVKEANQKIKQLEKAIQAHGFLAEELKTRSFTVEAKQENAFQENEWQTHLLGYEATHLLELSFPSDQQRLANLLADLAATKTNPGISIHFALQDAAKLQQKLLYQATQDARSQAEILAEASGLALAELVRIENEPENHLTVPTFQAEGNFLKQAADIPDFYPTDIEATRIVHFTWRFVENNLRRSQR